MVHHVDLSRFIYGVEVIYLERALEEFTKSLRLSSFDDDGTGPSLKVRLIALLSSFPKLNTIYEFSSSVAVWDGPKKFKRIDIHMKSLCYLPTRIIEIKSVPMNWLEASPWDPERTWFTLPTKEKAVKEIGTMSPADLMCLPLSQKVQSNWNTKFLTIGDYIEAGRKQVRDYLSLIESEDTLAYLVWAVGVTSIHVEHVQVLKK
eukprot:TRINITY_DN10823_c0_g3_i1.p2 TRINITY_DN10823_c0_g3~~TRINITY_DN10823_c0_g3_i1.p2  ORF type:complete len:204 (-),score=28.45 TRINITY_DN10823_c0_g3_i1:32-643(-)